MGFGAREKASAVAVGGTAVRETEQSRTGDGGALVQGLVAFVEEERREEGLGHCYPALHAGNGGQLGLAHGREGRIDGVRREGKLGPALWFGEMCCPCAGAVQVLS